MIASTPESLLGVGRTRYANRSVVNMPVDRFADGYLKTPAKDEGQSLRILATGSPKIEVECSEQTSTETIHILVKPFRISKDRCRSYVPAGKEVPMPHEALRTTNRVCGVR